MDLLAKVLMVMTHQLLMLIHPRRSRRIWWQHHEVGYSIQMCGAKLRR